MTRAHYLTPAIAACCVAMLLFGGRTADALTANDILKATGVQGGLVVHLGCGEGELTTSLYANDKYLVHGLDADAGDVAKARKRVSSAGLYGKVSVEQWSGAHLPYADKLVNLVVAEDAGAVAADEIMRVLAPRGVAYINSNGKWTKRVKAVPNNIDEWTHYLHDASNNAVAADTVVGPPKRYQWIAGPKWARSHDHLATISATVSSNGRLFYIVDEGPTAAVAAPAKWMLVARDAFNGVLLWKREIGRWEGHLRGFRSGPTELPRRLVAVGDHVYVTLGYGEPVCALEAATGETIRTFPQTRNALEIIVHEGALLVVAGDRLPDNTDGAARPIEPKNIWHWWAIFEETPPNKRIVALNADTGALLWEKNDADTVKLMPTTLCAGGKRVFYHSHKDLLALDASTGNELWRAPRPVNRIRPSWSAPTLVVYDDIVLSGDRAVESAHPAAPPTENDSQWIVDSHGNLAPQGELIAFSAETGKQLWTSDCRESYNSPPDVLVADGLVWTGELTTKREPGITQGLDVKTGEVARTRTKDQEHFGIKMGHHRCYRNKATEKYLVLGRDGIEFIDVKSGVGVGNEWVRGACQYGVMPCNGLVYAPPHSCACHIESKLSDFNALAAGGDEELPGANAERLIKGPAYAEASAGKPTMNSGDSRAKRAEALAKEWPTYRHDATRGGRASCDVPAKLKPAWDTEIPGGKITAPVIADGKVFVASVDTHTVHALDANNGEVAWTFIAGGRIDSPPTIHNGAAIFGCADGWVYCLRASDGELAWRYRAAPGERRIVSYGQIESAWPVSGSVLVQDDIVFAVAGRTTHLDGGMRLVRLDAATGKSLSETPITGDALPDVLSSDGENVYLRHRRFDTKGAEQTTLVEHLYSPAGFLDGSWWHRTYWQVGKSMGSGWGAWPNSGLRVAAGRILSLDDEIVYGFGRLDQYHRDGSHVGLGKARNILYSSRPASKSPEKKSKAKRAAPPPKPEKRWTVPAPIHARGMLLSGETLFVAGPPDLLAYAPERVTDPYHVNSTELAGQHADAMAGKKGARLMAVSAINGKVVSEIELASPPAWDGLAAANGRLYISTMDGRVVCLGGK